MDGSFLNISHSSLGQITVGREGIPSGTKPKQSKSRNGCVTCKGKRLKCDETKPTCKQCEKRGVGCGGYKKDFKWRAYEELNIGKSAKQLKKTGNKATKPKKNPTPLLVASSSKNASCSVLATSVSPFSAPFDVPSPYGLSLQYGYPEGTSIPSKPSLQYPVTSEGEPFPSPATLRIDSPYYSQTNQSSIEASVDIIVDTTDTMPVDKLRCQRLHRSILPLSSQKPTILSTESRIKEEVEIDTFDSVSNETFDPSAQFELWKTSYPSPPASEYSSPSPDPYNAAQSLAKPSPSHIAANPEALLFHFDNYTCSIMSMKNGLTENPWRTLIWPLAQQTPALYYALAALTAFHMSRKSCDYRIEGVEHMRQSMKALRDGLDKGSLEKGPFAQHGILATTLVLAFSESFDKHICTGSQHLKGAKILINQALANHHQDPQWGKSLKRLKFLHNVWVYLDVLARLTSDTGDDEVATSLLFGPLPPSEEIDPLMGTASTLFPLIGRVANLARKVRQSSANSPQNIAKAMELKYLLERWGPGIAFLQPEDRNMEVVHCFKTADAYKYATLLYLYQAIPDIRSSSSYELAKKVITLLDSVPISSGACIVHMYPLMVAGCEVKTTKERRWVRDRWQQMVARMWIGNVDKAWQVVKEVWCRRDANAQKKDKFHPSRNGMFFPQHSTSYPTCGALSDPLYLGLDDHLHLAYRNSQETLIFDKATPYQPNIHSSSECIVEEYSDGLNDEVSVKSSLHWLSVMKDWGWEVLLG